MNGLKRIFIMGREFTGIERQDLTTSALRATFGVGIEQLRMVTDYNFDPE